MTANSNAIKAALAGQGGTPALAWFAPLGTAAPTSTSSTLNAAYKDAGWCVQDGLTESDAVTTTQVPAFGTNQPVRILTTAEVFTIKVGFLETNPISTAIYYKKAVGAFTPASGGAWQIDEGVSTRQLYTAVFDITDGGDAKRIYCPSVEVTNKDDLVNGPLDAIKYGIELTCYPIGSPPVSKSTFLLVAAFAP